MTAKTYIPTMEAYLDHQIMALKSKGVIEHAEALPALMNGEENHHSRDNTPQQFTVKNEVDKLDQQLTRLEQIREWLAQDANLRNLVDAAISMQVAASERRQGRLSILLTVVSILVGWLLSFLATPATLTDLLMHLNQITT